MEETTERTVFGVVADVCRNYDHHVNNMAVSTLERVTHEQFEDTLADMSETEFFASYGRDAEDIICEELFDCYGEENLEQHKIEAPQFWVGSQDAITLARLIRDYRSFSNAVQSRIDEGNLEDAMWNAETAAYVQSQFMTLVKNILDAEEHGRVLDCVTPKGMVETV